MENLKPDKYVQLLQQFKKKYLLKLRINSTLRMTDVITCRPDLNDR